MPLKPEEQAKLQDGITIITTAIFKDGDHVTSVSKQDTVAMATIKASAADEFLVRTAAANVAKDVERDANFQAEWVRFVALGTPT